MSVPVKPKDLLRAYVVDRRNPVWAIDMVCMAINNGGTLTDDDMTLIWEELENNATVQTQTIPPSFGRMIKQVKISKLKHVSGVNKLADGQEIEFCEKGITLLFGQNRSGKSGYFRIFNQLANGEVTYGVLQDVFNPAPSPIAVTIEYKLDDSPQPSFTWNGANVPPTELRNIRLFDSQYAANILKSRDGGSYVFECYNLKIFRAIHETLHYLKNDLHVTIPPAVGASLDMLCATTYRDTLAQAMVDTFAQKLDKMGMADLQVKLEMDDLLKNTSQIKIRLTNAMEPSGVLSEAELKCAALAWFFAENELLEVKQPLVFDDPVNSLDSYIISAFARILSEVDNQVVVFTHNILLQEALTDERRFKVYYSTPSGRATTSKKHVWFYDVLNSVDNFGFVLWNENKKTLFYLTKANEKLASTPVTDIKGIVDDLRMAVEWAIDEVVFKGLASRRFKGSEVTDWLTMENMASAGPDKVRELKRIYGELSAMGIHVGYSAYAASPSPRVLKRLSDDIMVVFTAP